ncbi:hypothetical protein [Paraburkholderia sp. C35]|uniref:hypothetical protein n=1 Tax=Paraburkholderia sp. C35 TaxID=2126993 RepID=UPI000D69ABEB|nr:hypothetical protein [Paraburkholderia sp. C35]
MTDKGEAKWEKGDPLEILIRRENRTCAGCVFLKTDRLFNTAAVACRKRKRKAELCIDRMRRCELYDDGSKRK